MATLFLIVKKLEKLKGMSVVEWVNKGLPIQWTSLQQGKWRGTAVCSNMDQSHKHKRWWGSLVSMHNYTVKRHQSGRVQSHGVWACSVVEVTQSFTGRTQFAKYERKITSDLSCAISSYSVTEQNAFQSAISFSFLCCWTNYSLRGSCQSRSQIPKKLNFSQLSHLTQLYRTVSKPESRIVQILVS